MNYKRKYIWIITIVAAIAIFAYSVMTFSPLRSNVALKTNKPIHTVAIAAERFIPVDSNPALTKDKARYIIVEGFRSSKLNNDRSLHIYLPPSYYKDKDKKFPVMYVQDGKSVFDISDWSKESLDMHITADKLISEEKIEEVIIVGIDNIGEKRINEYAHWDGVDMGKPIKGEGLLYEGFVINDVKFFVDKNFRTLSDRENTALMGASIGGLATFNIGFRHPEVFSKLAMLSPYLGWGDGKLYNELKQGAYMDKKSLKMWVDAGSEENDFVNMAANGVMLLLNNGYKYMDDMAVYEAPGGDHSERFWAKRIESILLYFYGDIGKSEDLELFLDQKISLSDKQFKHINPVVTYDSGFKTTDVFGSYEVEKPEILKVQTPGGVLQPIAEGVTKVRYTSSTGLKAECEITIVK